MCLGEGAGRGPWPGWVGRKARAPPIRDTPTPPGRWLPRPPGKREWPRGSERLSQAGTACGVQARAGHPWAWGCGAQGQRPLPGPSPPADKIGRPPPCCAVGSPHLPYRPLRLSDPAHGGPSSVSCSGSSRGAPQRPAGPGGRFSGGCRTGAGRPGSVASRGQGSPEALSAGTSLRLESPEAMHRGSPRARPPPGGPGGGGVLAAGALGSTRFVSHTHTHTAHERLGEHPLCVSHTHTHTHTQLTKAREHPLSVTHTHTPHERLREHPLCMSHTHTELTKTRGAPTVRVSHTHSHRAHEDSGRLSHLPEVTEPGSRGAAHPGSAPQPLCLRPGPPDLTKGEDAWLHASPAHTRGCCLPWSLGPSCRC